MRVLDLFCGAGGAAMGLHRVWPHAEIVGVDIKPQPHYPFTFVQADAMTYSLDGFDFIWASPPCQAFSALKSMYNAKPHPNYIPALRQRLRAYGKPFVMENVKGAPLEGAIVLCGSMFRLEVRDASLRRHRLFESNFSITQPLCSHTRGRVIGVYGGHGRDRRRTSNKQDFSVADRRHAMGIQWMNGKELSQAIPPAYAEFIAQQLLIERSTP